MYYCPAVFEVISVTKVEQKFSSQLFTIYLKPAQTFSILEKEEIFHFFLSLYMGNNHFTYTSDVQTLSVL